MGYFMESDNRLKIWMCIHNAAEEYVTVCACGNQVIEFTIHNLSDVKNPGGKFLEEEHVASRKYESRQDKMY